MLAGLAGGLLAGLLGIGGGIIFLLVLPEALQRLGVAPVDMPATQVANALLATLFSALAACYQHLRSGTAGRADVAWVGLPAGAVALASMALIVQHPAFSEHVFSVVLLVILSLLLARTIYTLQPHPSASAQTIPDDAPTPTAKLAATGALAGLISSLTGLGGGILVVPALREWARYPVRRASFVSSGTIVISSLAALVFSLQAQPRHPLAESLGLIIPTVALPLGVGVVVAAPIGVRWAQGISPRRLTILYAVLVALVLARRIWMLVG